MPSQRPGANGRDWRPSRRALLGAALAPSPAWAKVDRREACSVLDFIPAERHAAIGAGLDQEDCAPAFMNALAQGALVRVPAGRFHASAIRLPGAARLIGEGYASHLKCIIPGGENWISATDVRSVTLARLRIDGARVERGVDRGSNLVIANSEIVFRPRQNQAVLRELWIEDPGFVGIYCHNAHGVVIEDVDCRGVSDSGIAVCFGSSEVRVSRCRTQGFRFGVSVSSDGVPPDVRRRIGLVRNVTVEGCTAHNDLGDANGPLGQGFQADGVDGLVLRDNLCVMDGGLFGFRLNAAGVGGPLEVSRLVTSRNRVLCKQDTVSAAIDITGDGAVALSGFGVVGAGPASRRLIGLAAVGDLDLAVSDCRFGGLGRGVFLAPRGGGSAVRFDRVQVTGCDVGFDAARSEGGRSRLDLADCDISGNDTSRGRGANLSVGAAFDLKLVRTAVSGVNYLTPGSLSRSQ